MLQYVMSCGGKRWHNELKWQILLGNFWYGPSNMMIGIIFLVLPFFCLVLVPLNIYIYYDIGLSTFEQSHCMKPSCKNQQLTFKLRNLCNLRIPALSNLNLCAPRMLSEDDPEDLQEGLEPWELPKKRLILVPLADREDCCGVGTFRPWNGLDHFFIIQVANLAVWKKVIIWILFSFFYIFLVLEYSSDSNERLQTWIKIFFQGHKPIYVYIYIDHQKFVFPVCHAGSRENSSCPRTKVPKATRGHTGHCWPWKDMVRPNQQFDVTNQQV